MDFWGTQMSHCGLRCRTSGCLCEPGRPEAPHWHIEAEVTSLKCRHLGWGLSKKTAGYVHGDHRSIYWPVDGALSSKCITCSLFRFTIPSSDVHPQWHHFRLERGSVSVWSFPSSWFTQTTGVNIVSTGGPAAESDISVPQESIFWWASFNPMGLCKCSVYTSLTELFSIH